MKKLFSIICLSFLTLPALKSQELSTLNLADCIELAWKYNPQVRLATQVQRSAAVNLRQSKMAFLPSLNAGTVINRGFGLTVDNVNQSIQRSPTFANLYAGLSLNVFSGLSNWNQLKVNRFETDAARYGKEKSTLQLKENITIAFFQLSLDKAALQIQQQKEALIQQQVERLQKQQAAGLATEGDVYMLQAQAAAERVISTELSNKIRIDSLQLLQLINLPQGQKVQFQLIEVEKEQTPDLEAPIIRPEIQELRARIAAQEYKIKVAKSAYYPSLTLGVNFGSRYSSAAQRVIGKDTLFGVEIPRFEEGTAPLFYQLDTTFSSSLTLTLSVPIFNNYRAKQNLELSRIALENARIELEMQENTLEQQLEQAKLELKAAIEKIEAAKAQQKAAEASFEYASRKYEAGLMDFYAYKEALNSNNKAASDLLTARYEYMLKHRILANYYKQ